MKLTQMAWVAGCLVACGGSAPTPTTPTDNTEGTAATDDPTSAPPPMVNDASLVCGDGRATNATLRFDLDCNPDWTGGLDLVLHGQDEKWSYIGPFEGKIDDRTAVREGCAGRVTFVEEGGSLMVEFAAVDGETLSGMAVYQPTSETGCGGEITGTYSTLR